MKKDSSEIKESDELEIENVKRIMFTSQ